GGGRLAPGDYVEGYIVVARNRLTHRLRKNKRRSVSGTFSRTLRIVDTLYFANRERPIVHGQLIDASPKAVVKIVGSGSNSDRRCKTESRPVGDRRLRHAVHIKGNKLAGFRYCDVMGIHISYDRAARHAIHIDLSQVQPPIIP